MHLEEIEGSSGKKIRMRLDSIEEVGAVLPAIRFPRFNLWSARDVLGIKLQLMDAIMDQNGLPTELELSRKQLKRIGQNIIGNLFLVSKIEQAQQRAEVVVAIRSFLED